MISDVLNVVKTSRSPLTVLAPCHPLRISLNGTELARPDKPIDYIGTKSIPAYAVFSTAQIHNISVPGCDAGQGRVFVGQRKESFYINLGEVVDLLNLDPLGSSDVKRNILDDKNITSFILDVPIACLTRNANRPVIGGWMTSSLRQARVLRPRPTFERPALEGGLDTSISPRHAVGE